LGIPFNFTNVSASAAASVNSLVSVLNTANTAFLTQTNAFIGSPSTAVPNQEGGGVWARGIGGRVDTESVGVLSVAPNASLGIGPGSVITCNTKTRSDYAGYQAGVDISRLNVGGVNIHFGATAGFVGTDAKDASPPPPGATFTGNFQIPFVGVYTALTYGGFFVDAQVRGDFYEMSLTDPAVGLFGQNLSARGTTVSSNVGYNQAFGNWFIEPSAGVIWSRVNVDPFNVVGTVIFAAPGLAPPFSVHVGSIESILGRASIRVGTNITAGNFALQPFATASVFHEFADNVTASLTTNLASLTGAGVLPPPLTEANATLSSSRVGTYGQFALGIAGQLIDTGWLGYLRADYRIGDNIEGFSVNGGLRYQFTPEQVAAVTKGIFKAPPAAAPVAAYNWTGIYIGGYAGTTWGSTNWTFVPVSTRTSPDFAGFVGGGQVGANYQMGNAVVGIEADGGWSNAKGGRSCPNIFFNCEDHMDWLATVTGRLGYTWGRTLVYAKGGFAAARMDERTVWNADSQAISAFFVPPGNVIGGVVLANLTPPVPSVQSSTATPTGWTLGAGIEFGLTPNWSAKAEYLYYDLGDTTYTFTANTFTTTAKIHETGNLVRVGVNYRFSGLY
jgi:opacity protein-like surface antigen